MINKNKKSPKISDFVSTNVKNTKINYFLTVFFTDFVAFFTVIDFPL